MASPRSLTKSDSSPRATCIQNATFIITTILILVTIYIWFDQVLSTKRYDLEGFSEYAHQLRECQSFDRSEADNIDYVLQVHKALLHHDVALPIDDKVAIMKSPAVLYIMYFVSLGSQYEVASSVAPIQRQTK